MKVRITDEAYQDLLQIGRTISTDSPARAESFVADIAARCQALGAQPRAYPLIPGREEQGVRRRPFGNYLIFYRISSDHVEVLHVLHGARDYNRFLFPEE
ncbi:MAG: type II toxin-antitoxin system RelE/ParE family toxin [Beijerinckiaceae bacterium]